MVEFITLRLGILISLGVGIDVMSCTPKSNGYNRNISVFTIKIRRQEIHFYFTPNLENAKLFVIA